jgi:hypothetical protein
MIEVPELSKTAGSQIPPLQRAGQVTAVIRDLPALLTAPLFRRWHLSWGATPQEQRADLPGDELFPQAQYRSTRAITINAPPEEVWPWLVQVGCGRAGFYSHDLLDNLARPSAVTILPEFQDLHIGQWVPMSPSATPTEQTALTVNSFEVDHWLLWSKPDSTWAWRLTADGHGGTRLVTRIHAVYEWRKHPLMATFGCLLMEFGDFAMLRAMLRGIKQRAESMSQPPTVEAVRTRGSTSRPFPSSRRLVTAAVRAGRRIVPMVGLFQVDLTAARAALVEVEPPLSMTAYVVAGVARAAAKYPEVHAYRDWRGRLAQHQHVDVQVLIEVPTAQGPFGLVHVIRDADVRSVADMSAEIRRVAAEPSSTGNGRLLEKVAPALGRLPGVYRVMYAVMGRSHRVHKAIGTVQVSSLGMFAEGGGFAIAPPSLASLTVVVGGISSAPVEADGHLETVELLDLTVSIDHNIVDGAPATRFAAELRRCLQSRSGLAAVDGPVTPGR